MYTDSQNSLSKPRGPMKQLEHNHRTLKKTEETICCFSPGYSKVRYCATARTHHRLSASPLATVPERPTLSHVHLSKEATAEFSQGQRVKAGLAHTTKTLGLSGCHLLPTSKSEEEHSPVSTG